MNLDRWRDGGCGTEANAEDASLAVLVFIVVSAQVTSFIFTGNCGYYSYPISLDFTAAYTGYLWAQPR